MTDRPEVPREDAEAALTARRDLGPDYEPAVVDSFVAQIEAAIERRVDERVEQLRSTGTVEAEQQKARSDHSLALVIVSICLAVPLTAIAAGSSGLFGIVLVWAGLFGVNALYTINTWVQRRL